MLKLIDRKKLNESAKLEEAGFLDSDVVRAFDIIARQISKRTGRKCYSLKSSIVFKDSTGTYRAGTIITTKGEELRFNMSLNGKGSNSITSVDYFLNPGAITPDFRVDLQGNNILQVLNVLSELLLNPRSTITQINESVINKGINLQELNEMKIGKAEDFEQWLIDAKVDNTYLVETKKMTLFTSYSMYAKSNDKTELSFPTFNLVMKNYLTSKGLKHSFDRVRVTKASSFDIVPDREDMELIDYIKENENSNDLSDSLDELKLDINVVSKSGGRNSANLLIVYGRAGISKTQTVKDTLKSLGTNYVYIRVNDIKNAGDFYKMLYRNNGRTILFDDSDIILKASSPVSSQLLAISDTNASNRTITYFNTQDSDILKASERDDPKLVAKKIPQQFRFIGSVICISNLPIPRMNKALISRAILSEVKASDNSIVDEIKNNIDKFFPEYSMDVKLKAVDFLIALRGSESLSSIDFRSYSMILQYLNSDLPMDLVKTILTKKLLKLKK